MNKKLASLTSTCGFAAILALGTAQAQTYLHQPFADADGTGFASASLVSGITGYSGSEGLIQTASALSYPGLVSSGNGYGQLNGRSTISLDLSPTGPLAAYIADGKIGGTGSGTLYISWMIRGANNGSGNLFELVLAGNYNADFGTLFNGGGYRLVASGDGLGGNQSYQNSNITPSAAGVDFLVAKVTFGPGNTDKVELFINQVTEGTPNVATGADRNVKFDQIAVANFGVPAAYDEIRIGATYADVAPASVEPAPNAPSALQTTVNSFSEVTLNWTDNSTNELNFVLERSLDGVNDWVSVATLPSETTTYQDVGLSAATTYHYRLLAANSGGNSAFTTTANATTSALPALVALTPIYLPFEDEDGSNAALMTLVPGVLAFTEPGVVQASSALTYAGLASSGNGFTTAGGRFNISLDTTLPGFARYMSGGQIGGSGLGVLYVRWLARGINAQEANDVEFSSSANGGASTRASVGTTFGNAFIRAMSASSFTGDIDTYVTSTLTPSAGTDLYVARFTFSPTGITTMDVFVNQVTEGTPDITTSGPIKFNTIGFAKYGGAAAPAIDELRIATTWAEAVNPTSAPLTSIQSWFAGYSLPTDGQGTGSLTGDNDGDGVVNLLEYAFKANPILADGGNIPSTIIVQDTGINYLAITFERLTSPSSGITYTPQASGDLADWSGVPVQVGTAVNNGDGTETVTFRDTVATSANPKRFLRVRVGVSAP